MLLRLGYLSDCQFCLLANCPQYTRLSKKCQPSVRPIKVFRSPPLVYLEVTLCRGLSRPRHLCQFSATAWKPTSPVLRYSFPWSLRCPWSDFVYTFIDFVTCTNTYCLLMSKHSFVCTRQKMAHRTTKTDS